MLFAILSIFCIASVFSVGPVPHRQRRMRPSPLGRDRIVSPSATEQRHLPFPPVSALNVALPLGSLKPDPEYARDASSSNTHLSLLLSLNSQWFRNPEPVQTPFHHEPKTSKVSSLIRKYSPSTSSTTQGLMEPDELIHDPSSSSNDQPLNALLPTIEHPHTTDSVSLELSLSSQFEDVTFFELFAPSFIAKLTADLNTLYMYIVKPEIISKNSWNVMEHRLGLLSGQFSEYLDAFLVLKQHSAVELLRNVLVNDLRDGSECVDYYVFLKYLFQTEVVVPFELGDWFYKKLYHQVKQVFNDHVNFTPSLEEWMILARFDKMMSGNLGQFRSQIKKHDDTSVGSGYALLRNIVLPTMKILKNLPFVREHFNILVNKLVHKIASHLTNHNTNQFIDVAASVIRSGRFQPRDDSDPDSEVTKKSSLISRYFWEIFEDRLDHVISGYLEQFKR